MFAGLALCLAACSQSPSKLEYHSYEPDAGAVDIPATEVVSLPDSRVPEMVSPDAPDAPDAGVTTEVGGPDAAVEVKQRDCRTTLAFTPPDGSAVFLAGEFTNWVTDELPLEDPDGDGTWEVELALGSMAAGSYGYKFRTAEDNWHLDPLNPLSKWVDGVENSKLVVPDCRLPELRYLSHEVHPSKGKVDVVVEVLNSAESQGLDVSSARVRVNGEPLPGSHFNGDAFRFEVHPDGFAAGEKVGLSFAIENEFGASEDLYVPLWLDDDWSWRDASIYFAFTDRFHNGVTANDAPADCTGADSPTNWHGGDFAGIKEKIESGYFDEMGINVLWISPVIDNPDGCMDGTLEGVAYTAYHGYFPVDIFATDEHFGTLEELREMVAAAHGRGLRVIIDFVANHVHEDNKLWKEHALDGWFHSSSPCAPAWDKLIECWFMPYLPDLDYTNDAVVELATDSALYWILETGIDGFRVDAVKHMVHNFMRTLRWKLERRVVTSAAPFYMVGETFTGDWGGGTGDAELAIKEYINDWELDGQFDFPFYWSLLRAVGRDEGDFAELAGFLEESHGYYGPTALMVSFIGNHDVPRFISHAAGQIGDLWGNDSKWQGFTDPPLQPDTPDPYLRLRLAMGLIFTLPECPMVYYGDEVGLAGAGDPDNRRDMVFDGLSSHQAGVLEFVRRVGTLRRELAPLRRGSFTVEAATADLLVFIRELADDWVVVAANRAGVSVEVTVAVPGGFETVTEALSGSALAVSGGNVSVALEPFGMAVLGPSGIGR